jgi:hypothetical protein
MAISQVPQANIYSTGSLSNSQTASSSLSDPQLFRLMLEQQVNQNLSSLFSGDNDEENSSSSLLGSSNDVFNFSGTTSSALTSPVYQMIAQSGLIGKSVEALDPKTGQTIKGQVQGVEMIGSQIYVMVGGIPVPPENLRRITP